MMMLYSGIGLMLLLVMGLLWQRPLQKMTLALLVLFPISALLLYWHWGNSQAWINYQQAQQLSKNLPNVNQIIQQLQSHLAAQPNSAEGWFLLGRLYASQQRYNDATQAFAKANILQPHQTAILINYAEAMFMQKNSANAKLIEVVLNEVLTLDPQNDIAKNLQAINFYQQKYYAKAIMIWEQLSEKYPPNTPDGQALLKAIAEAQQKMKT